LMGLKKSLAAVRNRQNTFMYLMQFGRAECNITEWHNI
jgi:hypothetical protein